MSKETEGLELALRDLERTNLAHKNAIRKMRDLPLATRRTMAVILLAQHGEDAGHLAQLEAGTLMDEAMNYSELALAWQSLADLIREELTPPEPGVLH